MAKSKVWSFRAEPDFFSEGVNLRSNIKALRFRYKLYKKKFIRLQLRVDDLLKAESEGNYESKRKAFIALKIFVELEKDVKDTG